jgi:hypothetical protein
MKHIPNYKRITVNYKRRPITELKLDLIMTQCEHIITCMGDYRRGLDWWLDLLTTYTLTRNYK